MFSFEHPSEIIQAVDKHCTAFYGSSIWRLSSSLGTVVSAWKTGIKLAWNVNRGCRSYFLDHVLAQNVTPLRYRLLSRFHTFFISLLDSPSMEVRVISRLAARDIRSNLGSNLCLLSEESGLNPWMSAPSLMKIRLRENGKSQPPSQDSWRVDYLPKLLAARQLAYYNCDQDEEIILSNIIDSLVIK